MHFFIKDFADFRTKAKEALRLGLKPELILWTDLETPGAPTDEQNLFEFDEGDISTLTLPLLTLKVPKSFIELGQTVEAHRDGRKWHHLYGLLIKIQQRGAQVLNIDIDEDLSPLLTMEKQIRRDIHKMHAFVRFKKVTAKGEDFFTAWHEPDHRILSKAAPFFQRRFGNMNWLIATPDGLATWDKRELKIEKRHLIKSDFASGPDAFEAHWLTYFSHIFNPARIKIKAMKKEMPVRFWKNLPETATFERLLAQAPARVEVMHKKLKELSQMDAREYLPPHGSEKHPAGELETLKKFAAKCQGCPLYANATQTVFGRGSPHAPVVLVGEQPGNEEDLQGEPFVGPAGKILSHALEVDGINPQKIYVTNAVKHFNFEPRGKFRLHKKPGASHIRACRPWLEEELKTLKPKMVICLGATAAQSVMGYQLSVNKERGKILKSSFCEQTLITFHPSFLLRIPDEKQKRDITKLFEQDLKKMTDFLN